MNAKTYIRKEKAKRNKTPNEVARDFLRETDEGRLNQAAERIKQRTIVVYGASDSPESRAILDRLERLGKPYQFVDIESDLQARQQVREWNQGHIKTPIVVIPEENQIRLTMPTMEQLDMMLKHHRMN